MKPSTTNISEHEWRFDREETLPEAQLQICHLYEYGREHAKGSQRWRKLTDQSRATKEAKQSGKGNPRSLLDPDQEIFSIFGGRNVLRRFYDPKFVTTPWQDLDGRVRSKEAAAFNEKQRGPQSFREFIKLSIVLDRDLPDYARARATDYDSWRMLEQHFHGQTDSREYGFFGINWIYTDTELLCDFKAWLEEKRGTRKATESERGRTKLRQYLKALGAKRLLDSGLTVNQAIAHTRTALKNGVGLYVGERGWSKAKNEIVPKILKHLFPPVDGT